tara:strand:+ start:1123 stop:1323 length:201 start_codon:yes stop_codon:yes gene_type:complete
MIKKDKAGEIIHLINKRLGMHDGFSEHCSARDEHQINFDKGGALRMLEDDRHIFTKIKEILLDEEK